MQALKCGISEVVDENTLHGVRRIVVVERAQPDLVLHKKLRWICTLHTLSLLQELLLRVGNEWLSLIFRESFPS